MTTREALHELVDELPDDVLVDVELYLREVAPPGPRKSQLSREEFLKLLADAPEDDEPLTEEDIAAIEEGWRSARHGKTLTTTEVERLIAQL